uniref:PPM-type phosphatase domain-containing protein n=1 Tax=Globodera rostochiensis TaxID=31243 RepID=A0A914HU48_GLORO
MSAVAEDAALKRSRSKEKDATTLENNNASSDFLITAASTQGGRKYMEDRMQIEVERNADGKLEFVYAAVYDGHGGTQASEYVRQHLFNNIMSNRSFFSEDDHVVLGAIREEFLRTHSDMRREAMHWPPTTSGFPCTAGTTATCAFIRNGKLYTGHVGDSSIILANFLETDAGYKDAKLTDDHKPDLTSERQRIERAGGAVAAKSGIFRVIWKRPMRGHRGPVRRSTATENIPFLAVARSLGDFWSLNPDSNEYVVSPEPDVDVFELKDTDDFIVIATDGLSTVVGIRAVIEALREAEQFKQLNGSLPADGNGQQNSFLGTDMIDKDIPLNHAHCLLQYAFKKWGILRADNISIICIKLNAKEALPEQNVLVDDPSLNVSEMLTEHPMGMIRISNNGTQLLRTNALRHRYFGTSDNGVKHSSQNRIGEIVDNLDARSDDSNSTRRNKRQPNATKTTGIFKGPGFILPELNDDDRNNNSLSDCNGVGGGLVDVEVVTSVSSNACESDVEELREPSELELALSTTSSEFDQHSTNGEESCRPQSRILQQHIVSPKPLAVNGTPKWKTKTKCKDAKPSPPARLSMKRRLEDDSDGCDHHVVDGYGEATMSMRVSLEGDDETVTVKRPPAKRSRIQNVVSFISNIFGFRWPT